MTFTRLLSNTIASILVFLLIIVSKTSFAQNQIGVLPQINFDFKLGNDWKLNSKLEGRQLFFQNPYPEGKSELLFERADLEVVATKTLKSNHSIGGGYLIRNEEGSYIHRFIQQYTITQKLTALKISHRFRTDQTFEKNKPEIYRLRYRISIEKPLEGLEIDPKEFYLKFNNEYFGYIEDSIGNLEIRGLVSLGYKLADNNKFEVGADYRAEDIINGKTIHKLFLNIGWTHSF